jgi:hypothetical protein
VNGFYHSAIGYVASIYFFINDGIESNGQLAGHWVWGTTLYTAMLLTALGKAALITKYNRTQAMLTLVTGQSGQFWQFQDHL